MSLEKSLRQRLLSSPLGLHTMLGSSETLVESRLVANLMAAEAALKEYQTASAVEDLLLQRIASAPSHATLRAALPFLSSSRQLTPSHLDTNSLLASFLEDSSSSATSDLASLRAALSRRSSPGMPSLSSLLADAEAKKRARLVLTSAAAAAKPLVIPRSEAAKPLKPEVSASAGHEAAQSLLDFSTSKLLQKAQSAPRRRSCKAWPISSSFPSKLFHMLEQAEEEGYDDVISFLPDGKAFRVHKPERFAQELLPKYFKTTRIASFQKQLSLYGFKKNRSGPNVGGVAHEFFQREDKMLMVKIQRKKQRVPTGDEGHVPYSEQAAMLQALNAARAGRTW